MGPGPRWGIAMSFNKQLISGTHATENDLQRHLHYKKCPPKPFFPESELILSGYESCSASAREAHKFTNYIFR